MNEILFYEAGPIVCVTPAELGPAGKPYRLRPDFRALSDDSCAPLLVSVKEAGRMLGISRSLIFEMLKAGKLERIKIRSATRIPLDSVRKAAGL